MMVDRGGDHHGVHRRVVDQLGRRGGDLDAGIPPLHLLQALRRPIAHHAHGCTAAVGEVADQVRPPVAVADHADADHACRPLSFLAASRRAGTPATVAPGGTSRGDDGAGAHQRALADR